jgi:hypothetical protein
VDEACYHGTIESMGKDEQLSVRPCRKLARRASIPRYSPRGMVLLATPPYTWRYLNTRRWWIALRHSYWKNL